MMFGHVETVRKEEHLVQIREVQAKQLMQRVL